MKDLFEYIVSEMGGGWEGVLRFLVPSFTPSLSFHYTSKNNETLYTHHSTDKMMIISF